MKKSLKKYVGSSPMKLPVWAPAAISAATGLIGAISGRRQERRARRRALEAEQAAAPYLEAYKTEEYVNPYEGMQNVYEGMRVDTQAQEFQQQQLAQQQADILQGLRGAAGGSGIAALAQAMARQGAVQAEKMSAQISQQEQAIQEQQLQEQARIQEMQMRGDEMVRQQERQRLTDLYAIEAGKAGVAFGEAASARQQMIGGLGQIASAGISAYDAGVFGGGAPSTSNLEMAPGSTLPGNTLDPSTMSSTYGNGPSYEVLPGYVTPSLTTENTINVSGFPSYTSPFGKKKK